MLSVNFFILGHEIIGCIFIYLTSFPQHCLWNLAILSLGRMNSNRSDFSCVASSGHIFSESGCYWALWRARCGVTGALTWVLRALSAGSARWEPLGTARPCLEGLRAGTGLRLPTPGAYRSRSLQASQRLQMSPRRDCRLRCSQTSLPPNPAPFPFLPRVSPPQPSPS